MSAGAIAFVALGLIWGSNFLFMKIAAEAITPTQMTLVRVACGFVPLLAFASATRVLRREHLRLWPHLVVMSFLATSLYYVAFATGTARLPSGVAGALSGAAPLFAFMSAAILLRAEALTAARLAGVVIGFAGVVVIARPWTLGNAVDPLGVAFMLAGAASLGLSFVYARRFLGDAGIPAAALTTYQIGLALVTLLVITPLDGLGAVVTDGRVLATVVIGLGVVGTGIAYLLYYVIVDRLGAINASSVSYVPPAIALAIGAVVANEPIDLLDWLGVALILAGVITVRLGGRSPIRRGREPQPGATRAA